MLSKDNYSVIKIVEQYARRVDFHYKGVSVADADKNLLVFSFTSLFCIGIDLRLDSIAMIRSYLPFFERNSSLDIIDFGTFLKVVDGVIKNYTEDYQEGSVWTYKHFKHACSCSRTYWDFIAPIKQTIISFLERPVAHLFRIINQWLNFLQRCNIRSLDLTTELIEKYTSFEHDMSEWIYDQDMLLDLSLIISEWCEPFTLQGMIPKHGPGSIAGRKGRPLIGEKYVSMGTDARLDFLSKYIGPIKSYTPCSMGSLKRCSDLVFVPKSLITQRTISKEPASLQYFQQGVSSCLLDAISRTDASKHIDLEHQEYSRTLALKGSISGMYATIDLSDASDSVTVELVKNVFRKPELRNALLCCRSDSTYISELDQEIKLSKFAPMGASTCFPVETLIFAACCELARRRYSGRKLYYRVYGDDIVIDYRLVESLLTILEAMHFRVNKSKSYWKRGCCIFREACGGEYFNGIEVSPLRTPRKLQYHSHITMQSTDVAIQYITLANKAFEYGYTTYRFLLLERLREMNNEIFLHIPYSTNGRVGIATWNDCCTNYRSPSRFNHKLQRGEIHALQVVNKTDRCRMKRVKKRALDDSIRLYEWFRSTAHRGKDYIPCPESVVTIDIGPKCSTFCYRWLSKPS